MTHLRKPEWLKSNKLGSNNTQKVRKILRKYQLTTVCSAAKCPNQGECFDRKTATFMILGSQCTRNCKFCAIESQNNLPKPDPKEPKNIAKMVKELNLKHIVITTVTRDDLEDGGAGQFVKTIQEVRKVSDASIETLISDLEGNLKNLKLVIDAAPDILNHNLETVPRLYEKVRPMAEYKRSLKILEESKRINNNILTKSGIMVGLGEEKDEVIALMKDLRKIDVDILTIGQYIAPSTKHFKVKEYVHPDIFKLYKEKAEEMGFLIVESNPLVRSSYHADKVRKYLK